jgi:hypothetical protein
LSVDGRFNVWKTFLAKTVEDKVSDLFDEEDVKTFAKYELDGCMIKNAVRMAYALAMDEGEKIGSRHIKRAVEAMNVFEQDINSAQTEEIDGLASESRAGNTIKRRRIDNFE